MTAGFVIAALCAGVTALALGRIWRVAYIKGRSDESEALLTLYEGRPGAYLDLVREQLIDNLGRRRGEAAYAKLAGCIKEETTDGN